MSLSPNKTPHRPLSRSPSSPSLAVGLPPPLPESNIMTPSSSSKHLKRSRSNKRVHRGDVESSADSSAASDNDGIGSLSQHDTETTPKRRVVHTFEAQNISGGVARTTKKRGTLQERLELVAKVKKSKSTSDGLSTSFNALSETSLVDSPSRNPRKVVNRPSESGSTGGGSTQSGGGDKVVVCVRIKPTNSLFATTAYERSQTSLTLSSSHPNVLKRGGKSGREAEYTYDFDALLQFPSRTPDLYESKVAPLVDKAMKGFNSTIFAYGQTGSGKSFTMASTGTASELGIIPCAVDGVFDAINAEPDRAYLLRVSYIEIYNETLRDLLNFKKGPLRDDEKPVIHTSKGKVFVDPLVEEIVSTPQDVVDLLEKGNAGRKIGATDWNDRSSRSHCVFIIVIESRPRDGDGDDDIRLSRLNLIDLAGSEKAVSDMERRGEGKHINQSLLALREVVHKLTEKGKRSHVPYRNSKLTHLLENALGGDSNICVICTLSAEEEHCAETLETLKFAGRCSQVETKARKNVLPSSERAVIRAKDEEIEELKRQLQGLANRQTSESSAESSDQITDLADSVAAMEARKSKLVHQLAKLNGEILTSELPRSQNGLLPLSPPKQKRRRISDFASPMNGGGRLGLGFGSPKGVANDRRAFSSMVRLVEEEAMPSMVGILEAKNGSSADFEHDRALAALKRTMAAQERNLAQKELELTNALEKVRNLSQSLEQLTPLQANYSALETAHQNLKDASLASRTEYETKLREQHLQLESTRSELVAVVEEKTLKIDKLEEAVLDLRSSREELVIEAEGRVMAVQKELETKTTELEVLKMAEVKTTKVLENVESERTGIMTELNNLKEVFETQKREHQELQARHSDLAASHQASIDKSKLLEISIGTLESQLQAQQNNNKSILEQLDVSTREKESLGREREIAVADLERFQKAAISSEAEAITELKAELAKVRKARDVEKERAEKAETGLKEMENKMTSLSADAEGLRRGIVVVKEERDAGLKEIENIKEKMKIERASWEARDAEVQADRATAEKERQVAAVDLAELRQQLESRNLEFSKLTSQNQNLSMAIEDITKTNVDLKQRLSDQQSNADSAAQIEINSLKKSLDASVVKNQGLTLELETLASQLDAKAQVHHSLEEALAQEKAKVSQIQQQSHIASTGFQDELAESRSQVNSLTEELRDMLAKSEELRRGQDDLQGLLKDASSREKGNLDSAASEIARLKRELSEKTALVDDYSAQMQRSTSQIEAHINRAGKLQEEVLLERTAKDAAMLQVKDNQSIQSDYLDAQRQIQELQQALAASQRDASRAIEEVQILQKRVENLSTEVIDLKASTTTNHTVTASISTSLTRHTSAPGSTWPLVNSGSVVNTLRMGAARQLTSAATGEEDTFSPSMRLRTLESEEIERLEKVVETQKIAIEDQKEKIADWKRKLEHYGKIVEELTKNCTCSGGSESKSTIEMDSPRRHTRGSQSMSIGSSSRMSTKSGLTKPGMSSTFTARNLALPSLPTPLPLHPSQYSNASSRTRRRVTIEHDIDLLADSNKVTKVKAVFDSPTTSPTKPDYSGSIPTRSGSLRGGGSGTSLTPKQRRP